MKTLNFKAFAKDAIKEKELNFLKGGTSSFKGDPVDDVLIPTRY